MPGLGYQDMYLDSNATYPSIIGGLAVGTPGEMRGWEMLHRRHGKLPWATLFRTAIKLARDGFTVTVDLADALINCELHLLLLLCVRRVERASTLATFPFLTTDPLWSEVYAPNGTLLSQNDICYRKRYADTLETISKHGADAFYSGPIAKNIVAAAQARNGIIQLSDLANYSAILRTPANITYRDKYRVFSTIAPSSGTVVLSAMKIFEGYPGSAKPDDPAFNLTTHRLIEVAACVSLARS